MPGTVNMLDFTALHRPHTIYPRDHRNKDANICLNCVKLGEKLEKKSSCLSGKGGMRGGGWLILCSPCSLVRLTTWELTEGIEIQLIEITPYSHLGQGEEVMKK